MKYVSIVVWMVLFVCKSYGQIEVSTFLKGDYKVDDALIFDSKGNLYGSHYEGSSVYKITPKGVATVFATGFNTPNGLAFDAKGHLHVCDNRGNRIYILDTSGVFLDTVSITNPSGIIRKRGSDTMIFTQYEPNRLSYLAPDGSIELIQHNLPLNGPVGLCYDDINRLYIGNFTDRKIYRYHRDSFQYIARIPGPSSGSSWLGFIIYANGYLWGTSFNGHKVHRVDPEAVDEVLLYAGSGSGYIDGSFEKARFTGPNGIVASRSGDTLFVSEYPSGRIRQIVNRSISVPELVHELDVYPNPCSSGSLYVYTKKAMKNAQVKIITANGQVVKNLGKLSGNQFRLETKGLSPGVYTIVLSSNSHLLRSSLWVL